MNALALAALVGIGGYLLWTQRTPTPANPTGTVGSSSDILRDREQALWGTGLEDSVSRSASDQIRSTLPTGTSDAANVPGPLGGADTQTAFLMGQAEEF